MTATTRPADLAGWRTAVRAETGLTAIEVGDLPDESHKSGGGRHCGRADIANIGKDGTDYSVRQARDRAVSITTNDTCASDIGLFWPRGGTIAAVRFNLNVAWELQHSPELLPALCEINYVDGDGNKLRYYIPTGHVVSTTDSVDIHTHLGFWRDTANTSARAATLLRLRGHLIAARDNIGINAAMATLAPPAPSSHLENDMIFTITGVPAGVTDITGTVVATGGQFLITPHGLFNLTGAEFFSLPAADQGTRITMPYVRALALANGWKQDPIDVATLAAQIAAQFPQNAVTTQVIIDALQSEAGMAALEAAAEYAGDH